MQLMRRTGLEGVGGAIGVGVVALLSQGLIPALLGGLAHDHRLDDAGLGLAAAVESVAITLASGAAATLLRPQRLRLITLIGSVVLAASCLAVLAATSQAQLIALRLVAGAAEGVLFWIALTAVANARLAERAAGVLMATVTLATLAAAAILTRFVLPAGGTDAGFVLLAALSALGCGLAFTLPDRGVADRADPSAGQLLPGPLGWAALLAAFLFNAAGMSFLIYLLPLATQAGLSEDVAGQALTVLIAAQLAGSLLATVLAGRMPYLAMLILSAVGYAIIWPVYALHPSAALFVAIGGAHGLITFFALPFLYPLAIGADPTRQAAVLLGPAQMLGSAAGPLLAATVVRGGDVLAIVPMSLAVLTAAMAVVLAVAVVARRSARGVLAS